MDWAFSNKVRNLPFHSAIIIQRVFFSLNLKTCCDHMRYNFYMKLKFGGTFCLILLLGSVLLAACSLIPEKTSPADLTATVIALTPTAIPATPTPLPPLAILIAPGGADQVLAGELEQQMKSLAEAGKMRFQVRPSLTTADLTPDVAIVAALPPDPGLAGLSQAAPDTQFIGVGIDGLTAGGNLSVIHSRAYDGEDLAFIAGYIAGVITPDWRAGILLPADQNTAAQLLQAYGNGLHFWCGLCQPLYAPFVVYPQSAQVTNPADPVATLSTVDTLTNLGVTTIYIPGEVSTSPLLEYIGQKQVVMIGSGTPPASVAQLWVVSLRTGDPLDSFRSAWDRLVSGNGGFEIEIPLELAETGAGLLDEARQRVVNEMLDELSNGLIDPGLVPE